MAGRRSRARLPWKNLLTRSWTLLLWTQETTYTFLRTSHEGQAMRGERALGKEISYSWIGRAKTGDIVLSNINAVNKAICVLPPEMEGLLVSNEFTILRLKKRGEKPWHPQYIWSVLRRPRPLLPNGYQALPALVATESTCTTSKAK